MPFSSFNLLMAARISSPAMGSSWEVGSSRRSTRGCMASTEPRMAFCFSPPDSWAKGGRDMAPGSGLLPSPQSAAW